MKEIVTYLTKQTQTKVANLQMISSQLFRYYWTESLNGINMSAQIIHRYPVRISLDYPICHRVLSSCLSLLSYLINFIILYVVTSWSDFFIVLKLPSNVGRLSPLSKLASCALQRKNNILSVTIKLSSTNSCGFITFKWLAIMCKNVVWSHII